MNQMARFTERKSFLQGTLQESQKKARLQKRRAFLFEAQGGLAFLAAFHEFNVDFQLDLVTDAEAGETINAEL